ncbi:MAG: preprotein translocase subunit SecA [Alphaproteobacteria bacterium CG11_big_fil_rev_8_21_14_0_20_39_49]|nr:MAG: preprotein translocase subunit SecA [Alphaproteobacteria bacterium CG11_big_fil_rev_8_21_14_0_20_39_49]
MKFNSLAKKMFGTANDRILKSMQAIVNQINSLEEGIKSLSDDQLKNKTSEFKQRLKDGASIDDILPEAFAVVREVSWRVMGMRHFDVQLLGGIILHRGMIAEMKTGEGKTLSATLPVYLNALEGKGVHVVTVNDYLAQRDSKWMGQIYGFLGMSVSCVINSLDDEERQAAYGADITYGTNNEFGFDYLRDNMKFSKEEMVQRGFNYAIVDEVDSILIDEARTPLIISGPTEDNSELYHKVDKLIPLLDEKDYEKDEKARSVTLTEDGTEKIEQILKNEGLLEKDGNLYDLTSISLVHHINQALRAHTLFSKDTDYIVKDGKVIIIDEFTGRMMEGRRFSDGMHQALEAKENVPVQNENQTLASVTFQNYFRLYNKLAGMTGTAMTEANEFADIYKLEVVAVPPNLKVARIDDNDDIYSTALEKYEAIADKIEECHKSKQPVLVGTISIEQSELVASFLKKKKIPHNILNAKQHAKEAYIIAQAGRLGAVTIATNMAGRGTDIMLGGNFDMMVDEEITKSGSNADRKAIEIRIKEQIKNEKQKVIEAGGLFVLGTERHESRRIDNQLRGRSGRQGDPGMSKFYLSLEDDLMRIFGSEKIQGLLKTFGLKDGEAIAHPMISRSIEKAQQKVEAHNYEIRKSLLKFDDVMNDQRKVIYEQRLELMTTEDVSQDVKDMRDEVTENIVSTFIPAKSYPDQWDTEAMEKEIFRLYGIHADVTAWAKEEGVADKEILEKLDAQVDMLFEGKEKLYTPPIMRMIEKRILLITLDQLWKEHLLGLDHLKQGIGLRAYGQKDPLNEYKREAFKMFESMLQRLNEVVTTRLAHIELSEEQRDRQVISQRPKTTQKMKESRVDPALQRDAPVAVLEAAKTRVNPEERDPAAPESWGRVGRNEPCPCGSGKKYKQCHGQI